MKLRIKKNYHRDTYWFWTRLELGKKECTINFLFKEYKAIVSDDFKRVLLIDPIEISGIMGDKPKTLKYLTINKYDVRDVKEHCSTILI